MTYIIAEPCLNTTDTACVDVCPVDCIYLNNDANPKLDTKNLKMVSNPVMKDGAALDILFIHPTECIDCGACEPECPPEAIFAESDVPANMSAYIPLNYEAFGLSK